MKINRPTSRIISYILLYNDRLPILSQIYEFLSKKYPNKAKQGIHKEIVDAREFAARVINKYQKMDPLCKMTVDVFVQVGILYYTTTVLQI
jgi:hypothetical protein